MPITELRIEGLRTIEKLRLKLDGLTVLIGDNGSGKSSILEGCEILRRATGEHFMGELHTIHGGLRALLRQGAPALKLGVTMRPQGREPVIKSVEYDLVLTPSGSFARLEEKIRFTTKARPASRAPGKKRNQLGTRSVPAKPSKTLGVLYRQGHFFVDEFEDDEGVHHPAFELDEDEPFLSRPDLYRTSSTYDVAAQIAADHLRGLTIHLPFETLPAWVARALDRKSALRNSTPLAPASKLERLGLNLANAFHALKNSSKHEEWQRTLSYIRLGLGEHIEDVATLADPSGGSIALSLKLKNLDQQVPASHLSDGMLSYLAFVALFRFSGPDTSLLGFDEPDVHLHPKLLMRVLDMFEAMARDFPVLVATHSDRLLDGLSDPARSVVLCELDLKQTTRLLRPDPRALARWLERYRGIGDLRGAGHEASVLTRKEPV